MTDKNKADLLDKELDKDELDQVAGGGSYPYGYPCKDTFKPDENCFFTDRCNSANLYYKLNPSCSLTYDPAESCISSDACKELIQRYPERK